MSKFSFCFPGQGSQSTGMLEGYAGSQEFTRTIEQASQALGEDLTALAKDEAKVNMTVNAQPLLLAASVGAYRAWEAKSGIEPALLAGHSLGEYSAMVVAGSLGLEDAMRLVRTRAKLMQAAVPEGAGGMAAVLGLPIEQVEQACQGKVWVANHNSPVQVVISGLRDDLARAVEACRGAGAKRVVELPVSVPSHCQLMEPARQGLADQLASCEISDARIPIVQNASGLATTGAASLAKNLVEQLVARVDWIACAQELGKQGNKVYECGPGNVLHGLNRRILEAGQSVGLGSLDAIEASLA